MPAIAQKYDYVQVQVPHLELKRFKTIVRALGCVVETMNPIQRSLWEADRGDIIHYDSLDDLIKEVG